MGRIVCTSQPIFSSGGMSMAEQLSQHMMGPGTENVRANTCPKVTGQGFYKGKVF